LSIDGNFGLCRKKAAGKSVKSPSTCFFLDQSCVDLYVEEYSGESSLGNDVYE